MVDLVAQVDGLKYDQAQTLLDIKAGEYRQLESHNHLTNLLEVLTGNKIKDYNIYELITNHKEIEIIPGSTGLGVFSAFPIEQRKNCIIHTSAGSRNGNISLLSDIFANECNKLGISYSPKQIEGDHPLGITITSKNQPDKLLAMLPGVASELDSVNNTYHPQLTHIDAYELDQSNLIGQLIDKKINEHNSLISLGLGNPSILNLTMSTLINKYINAGKIDFLFGSLDEYRRISPFTSLTNSLKDIDLKILDVNVPNMLITNGAEGMIGKRDNKWAFQEALKVTNVLNTAGAGDTAAGAFLSDSLNNIPLQTALRNAVYFSAQVISTNHTKLQNGR